MSDHYDNCRGVIHVGANTGQERDIYAQHDLWVIWFEPNPDLFPILQSHIKGYPKQKAYPYLVSDKDGEIYTLNISSHIADPKQIAQSSSIFDLHKHKEIWPAVYYSDQKKVSSITLDAFIPKLGTSMTVGGDIASYQKLHVDTQGADLLVLKGAIHTLRSIRYVQIEVSSMELYKDGCVESEVTDFLAQQGFKLVNRGVFVDTPQGTCSENLYEKA